MAPRLSFADTPGGTWVVIVTVDTWRWDHLYCLGYPRVTTPFLEKLTDRSALFLQARTAASLTNPCHVSLFTGLEVPQHKVFVNHQRGFDQSIGTLAQWAQRSGYRTAAFTSVGFLRVVERGFEVFDTPPFHLEPALHYRPAQRTIDAAVDWLTERQRSENVFLWVHLYDPHTPYRPPVECLRQMQFRRAAARDQMLEHWLVSQRKSVAGPPFEGALGVFVDWQNWYDAEIYYADRELARLWDFVEQQRGKDSAFWIITGDHGEGMGNHGESGHGRYLYLEQVAVPLFLCLPGAEYRGLFVREAARQIDLYPTVLEYMGISPGSGAQPVALHGQSLLPMLAQRGTTPLVRRHFAYRSHKSDVDKTTQDWTGDSVYCLDAWPYRYTVQEQARNELYNLMIDPCELRNLADDGVAAAGGIREQATSYYDSLVRDARHLEKTGTTIEFRDELEALGYI